MKLFHSGYDFIPAIKRHNSG